MEGETEDEDEEHILMGSGEYQVVGIRYYKGVAHPGEFVTLNREPNNPYDRYAIRVDNMHEEKVGHVKRGIAAILSPLMDRQGSCLRLEGSIPRHGNQWTLPLKIDFYASGLASNLSDLSNGLVTILNRALKHDHSFKLSPTFVGGGSSGEQSNASSVSTSVTVKKEVKRMDWKVQAKELDEMFDKQCDNQLKDLPELTMPVQFKNVTLFQHQIDGIKWLVNQEKQMTTVNYNDNSVCKNPFFREVKEGSSKKWLCEITQCSQSNHPSPIKGSILADEMGLGKTIQTIGLILLSPPQGHTYFEGIDADVDDIDDGTKAETSTNDNIDREVKLKEKQIPIPSNSVIKSQTVTTLKSILKLAGMKQSGRKSEIMLRVCDGIKDETIRGEHFPLFMTTPPPTATIHSRTSLGTCTLIVCPASVMSNWQHQISNFVKEKVLTLDLYHGPNRKNLLPQLQEGKIDVLLVTYQTLSSEIGNANVNLKPSATDDGQPAQKKSRTSSIFDINFHRIVLDEGHTIRNKKTKYFKATNEIKADRKLVLTGTPMVNKTDDIFSLFSFLNVEPLHNQNIFWRAISQPIKDGHEIGLTRLRTAMSYVALRRSKTKVGIQLADKEVQLSLVSFNDDRHGKTYRALFGTFRIAMQAVLQDSETTVLKNYSSVFEKILRMRQSCCSAMLVPEKRRNIALDMWEDLQSRENKKETLTKEEGLALLEKLQGVFTQTGDENELPECAICLMEMEEQDSIILRKCGHVFCNLCIASVLKMSNKHCPLCRNPFVEEDMIDKKHAKAVSALSENISNNENSNSNIDTPPKILALLEAMKEMKNDEKGVIFSQFTSFLNIIGTALKDAGYDFVRIDGSVNPRKRIDIIKAFSSDDQKSPRFILCSLHAAGTGINLTRGNHAFMMDAWWNESIESQAMDRIHRIGQTRDVKIIRFVMKDSIEERMVALQKAKSLQAKGAMEKLNAEEKRKARIDQLKGLLLLTDDDE